MQLYKMILFIFVTILGAQVFPVKFDMDSLPENLGRATQEFLDADTPKARATMSKFSDEDLQKITNIFKKSHGAKDQRIFWLIEESYRRNAERVAAERIQYLYYAVIAALTIIAAFCGMTYARHRVKP